MEEYQKENITTILEEYDDGYLARIENEDEETSNVRVYSLSRLLKIFG